MEGLFSHPSVAAAAPHALAAAPPAFWAPADWATRVALPELAALEACDDGLPFACCVRLEAQGPGLAAQGRPCVVEGAWPGAGPGAVVVCKDARTQGPWLVLRGLSCVVLLDEAGRVPAVSVPRTVRSLAALQRCADGGTVDAAAWVGLRATGPLGDDAVWLWDEDVEASPEADSDGSGSEGDSADWDVDAPLPLPLPSPWRALQCVVRLARGLPGAGWCVPGARVLLRGLRWGPGGWRCGDGVSPLPDAPRPLGPVYVGCVTRWLSPVTLLLDGDVRVLLYAPPTQWVPVGVRVALWGAHPQHSPPGLALCPRGWLQVLAALGERLEPAAQPPAGPAVPAWPQLSCAQRWWLAWECAPLLPPAAELPHAWHALVALAGAPLLPIHDDSACARLHDHGPADCEYALDDAHAWPAVRTGPRWDAPLWERAPPPFAYGHRQGEPYALDPARPWRPFSLWRPDDDAAAGDPQQWLRVDWVSALGPAASWTAHGVDASGVPRELACVGAAAHCALVLGHWYAVVRGGLRLCEHVPLPALAVPPPPPLACVCAAADVPAAAPLTGLWDGSWLVCPRDGSARVALALAPPPPPGPVAVRCDGLGSPSPRVRPAAPAPCGAAPAPVVAHWARVVRVQALDASGLCVVRADDGACCVRVTAPARLVLERLDASHAHALRGVRWDGGALDPAWPPAVRTAVLDMLRAPAVVDARVPLDAVPRAAPVAAAAPVDAATLLDWLELLRGDSALPPVRPPLAVARAAME